jgi:hypothetical protein
VSRAPKLATFVLIAVLAVTAWAAVGGAASKSSTTTLGSGEAGSIDVRCKKGQRVVGVNAVGEAEDLFTGGPGVSLGEVSRPGKRRAQAAGINLGSGSGDLTVIARCKRQPKSKRESKIATVPPAGMDLETESVSAKCPRGERIVFGGFRAEQRSASEPPGSIIVPTGAKREGARRWTVEAFNFADGPDDAGELASLVYCGDVKRTGAHTETEAVEPFETGSATARCPRGTKLRYGGFEAHSTINGAIFVTGLERTGGRTFRASGFAFSMTPLDLTAIAYCR